MNYYHASKTKWAVGDIITAQYRGYGGGVGIYVSTRPEPHFTLENQEGLRLYKVKPLNKVKRGTWGDLVCKVAVEVVECLGGIAKDKKVSAIPRKHTKQAYVKKTKASKHKPKWGVYKTITPSRDPYAVERQMPYEKLVRGFRKKKHAEQYAKKHGYTVRKKI